MGFIEVRNGSGFTLRMENDKESLNLSTDRCVSCNDDRLLHDGQYLVCTQCHCRQNLSVMGVSVKQSFYGWSS
jgi:uncharacterized membrane protein